MFYTQLRIDDYHIYKLRLTLIDVVQLERLLGESPLNILYKATQGYDFNLEGLIMILYTALMQDGDKKYSIDDAYDIFDDYIENVGDVGSFFLVLLKLFEDMGFISQNNEEETSENDGCDDEDEVVDSEDMTLEARFSDLLIKCLEAGITEEFFWKSTYGEMLRYMKAYSNRLLRERQDKASFDYQLSNLIGISVSRLFSSDSKFPEIYDVYPTIFNPPSDEDIAMAEAMKMQARMLEYTEHHNAKKQIKEIEELYGIKVNMDDQ